jgi:hypothetical protein
VIALFFEKRQYSTGEKSHAVKSLSENTIILPKASASTKMIQEVYSHLAENSS